MWLVDLLAGPADIAQFIGLMSPRRRGMLTLWLNGSAVYGVNDIASF
jgi:hypothetical protein